jgi:uncharacterized protein (DUF1778 family)
VLPPEVFDELLERLDEPPQPNAKMIELMLATRGRIEPSTADGHQS